MLYRDRRMERARKRKQFFFLERSIQFTIFCSFGFVRPFFPRPFLLFRRIDITSILFYFFFRSKVQLRLWDGGAVVQRQLYEYSLFVYESPKSLPVVCYVYCCFDASVTFVCFCTPFRCSMLCCSERGSGLRQPIQRVQIVWVPIWDGARRVHNHEFNFFFDFWFLWPSVFIYFGLELLLGKRQKVHVDVDTSTKITFE